MGKLHVLTPEQREYAATKMQIPVTEVSAVPEPPLQEARIGGRPLAHWHIFLCYGIAPGNISTLFEKAEVARSRRRPGEGADPDEEDLDEIEEDLWG